jgi:hypothetical protein
MSWTPYLKQAYAAVRVVDLDRGLHLLEELSHAIDVASWSVEACSSNTRDREAANIEEHEKTTEQVRSRDL